MRRRGFLTYIVFFLEKSVRNQPQKCDPSVLDIWSDNFEGKERGGFIPLCFPITDHFGRKIFSIFVTSSEENLIIETAWAIALSPRNDRRAKYSFQQRAPKIDFACSQK